VLGLIAFPVKVVSSEMTIQEVTPVEVKQETVEETIRRVAAEEKFSEVETLVKIATEVETLVKIARCESRMIPTAKNPHSTATGVFQILKHGNLSTKDRENVEWSTKWAIENFNHGFPWTASKHCWNK